MVFISFDDGFVVITRQGDAQVAIRSWSGLRSDFELDLFRARIEGQQKSPFDHCAISMSNEKRLAVSALETLSAFREGLPDTIPAEAELVNLWFLAAVVDVLQIFGVQGASREELIGRWPRM